MKIVTGYRGEVHITPNDDQGRNQGTFGTEGYVLNVGNKFAATLQSSNALRIADGEGVFQGVHFRVEPGTYDTVTIENGTQSMQRIDLVVMRYTKNASTSVESCALVVIKGTPIGGTPAVPAYNSGNILSGALIADMPLYQVRLNGITVQSVTPVFDVLSSMRELQEAAEENEAAIAALNSSTVSVNYGTLKSGYTGNFQYVKIGRLVICNSTITSSSSVAALTELVTGIPVPSVTNAAIIARNNSPAGWANLLLRDNGAIMNVDAISTGFSLRMCFAYISAS